ncbi:hypothetical protein LX36DRAFT_571670 [Colletotrichum falcatum]|nr:hypothetical protein LX36DRAFT_571670 [Colletotrichum falcatum]
MRFSTLRLCVCCISGATLVAALPSSGPNPNLRDTAVPPNANVPPFESVVLVDGVQSPGSNAASTKRDLATRKASTNDVSGVQARQVEVLAVIGVTAAAVVFTAAAFTEAALAIKGIFDFNKARKKFTTTQTEEMWKRNPDYEKFPAAACYSLGYRLANPDGFTQLANITLSAGGDSVTYVLPYVCW